MTQITREIDGKTYVFQLSEQEIRDIVTTHATLAAGLVCVELTVIRERASENERWVDTHRMLMPAAEVNGVNDDVLAVNALKRLREGVTRALTSPSGWDDVVAASMDFNWGDAVIMLSEESVGCLSAYDTTKPVRSVLVSVNQDETLMPDAVPCTLDVYGLHQGKADLIAVIPATVDMTEGAVCPSDNDVMAEIGSNGLLAAARLVASRYPDAAKAVPPPDAYFAVVTFGEAGSVPCDPDGGFLCLVADRDFLYECSKGHDALIGAMKRVSVPA